MNLKEKQNSIYQGTDESKTTPTESDEADNTEKEIITAPLESLEDTSKKGDNSNEHCKLDSILDIPVTISMEVGRSQISVRNLLKLNQGSVVELDRIAGEALDVMINGTLIAHGEVVVINDKFGIRLTDVISQTERIKKFR